MTTEAPTQTQAFAIDPPVAHACATALTASAQRLHAAATALGSAAIQQAATTLVGAATGLHRIVDELEANRIFAAAATGAALGAATNAETTVTSTGQAIAVGVGEAEGDLDAILPEGAPAPTPADDIPTPPDPEEIRRRWPLPALQTAITGDAAPADELRGALADYTAATHTLATTGWTGANPAAADARFTAFGAWLAAAIEAPTAEHPAQPAL